MCNRVRYYKLEIVLDDDIETYTQVTKVEERLQGGHSVLQPGKTLNCHVQLEKLNDQTSQLQDVTRVLHHSWF